MNYPIVFKEQAREEVANIVQWYEQQRKGLGDIFLTELKQWIELLSSNPYLYQIRRKNIRLGILKHFPYIIAYQIEQEHVIIYAVLHEHRHPKNTYKRNKKK